MNSTNNSARPHSEEYFGDDRDFYWNRDFVELIGRRLRLGEISFAADIGCGVGHWSELVYPFLAPGATIVGVDRETEHLARYRQRMRQAAPRHRDIACYLADAACLPLQSDSFELTTCQTLLLHLEDPVAALQEMLRVTRPGGLILCLEPNNVVARLPFASMQATDDLEQMLRLSEFAWRHAIGRQKRGLGAEYIGEQLPGMLKQLGLDEIQVWLSDKTSPFVPPYETSGERAILEASGRW